MGFFNKFSNKLVILYLLVTIVPLSMITLYHINASENMLLENRIDDFTEDISFIGHSLESELRVEEDMMVQLTYFITSIDPSQEKKSMKDLQDDFLTYIMSHPSLSEVGYIDKNGKEMIVIQKKDNAYEFVEEPEDKTSKDFFYQAMGIYESNVKRVSCGNADNGNFCLIYSSPVQVNDTDAGVVYIYVDVTEKLDNIISEFLQMHDDLSFAHFPEIFILTDELGEYIFTIDIRGNLNDNHFVKPGMILKEEYPNTYRKILSVENGGHIDNNHILGYDSINMDGIKFILIGTLDYEKAIAPVMYMHNMIYFILIVALVISIVASVFLARRFTSPITELIRCAKSASKGRLNVKVNIKTKDEFQEFAEVFNEMIDKIKTREKDIDDKASELEGNTRELKSSKSKLEKNVMELRTSRTAMLNIMEDINKANEELTSLDKAKDEFLSIVSHELKTPITPIKTYIEMLIDHDLGPLNKRQMDGMKVISRNVARLKLLIEDLLDITRLETGKMKLNMEKINIKNVVHNVIKERHFSTKKKGLKLKSEVSKVPCVNIDFNRIIQVITNLIDNSIKFTPPGGTISVIVEKKKKDVIISVKDTGIGISEEHFGKVFEKFYQVDSSLSRKFGGTGLGLSICKGIVEEHGGRIWLESTVNKGTKVSFSLPFKRKK